VTARRWPHRLAAVTAGATVGLIVAGGLVTNTGAALAVPDWPTTFGENMFLYPWARLAGGALVEHSHRVFGAVVGLLTLATAATLGLGEARRWVRWLGVLAVALVCTQGLVGGLRVVLLQDTLAMLHGALAQAFFALLTGLTVLTGAAWARPPVDAAGAGRLAPLGVLAAGIVYLQVLLGTLTTHAGWLWWHVSGAVVTAATLVGLALTVRRRAGADTVLRWWARAVKTVLAGQLLLGLGAYAGRFSDLGLPGGQVSVVGLAVAHRAMGALVLGSTVALALHLVHRRALARPAGAPAALSLASTTGATA
jgi:cytochrome c oxidase assembly protein subunit 15